MDDPIDNCDHWVGNMPARACRDCDELLDDAGEDKLDPLRCPDCADQNRVENELSHCCAAPWQNVTIAHSETEGDIYADYYTCDNCGGRSDA